MVTKASMHPTPRPLPHHLYLVPVHDVWRLTDPNSFFDLSESHIILPVNYFCPLPIDDMISPSDMITARLLIEEMLFQII